MLGGMRAHGEIARDISEIRAFNRFYTQRIGVLDDAPLGGPFTLTEARVLYELAHRDSPAAVELGRDLALDRGYLSRILARFQKKGLLQRSRSASDGRQSHITLTEKGVAAFDEINEAWQSATEELVAPLAPAARRELVEAIQRVRALLGSDAEPADVQRIDIRSHQLGDMGWIIERHAVVYGAEYGWDDEFEALVAEICAKFIRDYDPAAEHCWIATLNGALVGSVFLVKDSDEIGRLRLLFVEPSARGHGIGRRLVDACVKRGREVGYRKVTLWTNDVLVSARRIYQAAGFRLVREWPDHKFGKDLVGQDWELEL